MKYNFGIKKQIYLSRSVFTRLDENRDIQCVLEESFIFLTERSHPHCSPYFIFFHFCFYQNLVFSDFQSNLRFFLLFFSLDPHILSIFVFLDLFLPPDIIIFAFCKLNFFCWSSFQHFPGLTSGETKSRCMWKRESGWHEECQWWKILRLGWEGGLIRWRFSPSGWTYKILNTRSLGALRAPTSSWRPFGPLDFVLRALYSTTVF